MTEHEHRWVWNPNMTDLICKGCGASMDGHVVKPREDGETAYD